MVIAMRNLVALLIGIVWLIGLWFPVHAAANARLDTLVAKIDRLENYVYENNWQDIRTYIRGPLGQLRRELALVQRDLPNEQKPKFKSLSNQFLNDLIDLDFAALNQSADRTEAAFKALKNDLSKMLDSLE